MASSAKKAKGKKKAAKKKTVTSKPSVNPEPAPPKDVDAPAPVHRMTEVIDMAGMPFEKQMSVLFNPFQGVNEKAIVGKPGARGLGDATLPSTK